MKGTSLLTVTGINLTNSSRHRQLWPATRADPNSYPWLPIPTTFQLSGTTMVADYWS